MTDSNEKIYIILTMSGTKFSKFLRFMSGESPEFTHVSLSMSKELDVMHSFGRKIIHLPFIAGYVEERIDAGVYKIYNPNCEVLEVSISPEQYRRLDEILTYVNNHKNAYGYNFVGLVLLYFNIPHKLYNRFTCTEFVAWLLYNIGIKVTEKDVSLTLPMDYYEVPYCKSIYKGKLSLYT